MATDLTGLKVQNTYNALLKIGDNSDLTGIAKVVSDGEGHETVLYLSTSQVGIGGVPDSGIGLHIHGNMKVGNIETTGYLRAPATFTIDPSAHGDNTGTVVIAGDLRVDGTTTTINSTTVSVNDKNIVLGDDAPTDSDNNGAGISVYRPDSSNSYVQWNETTDQWDFSHSISANTTGSSANWTTARTITIGDTGKSVDGSANVSWSKSEIGFDLQDVTDNGATTDNDIIIQNTNPILKLRYSGAVNNANSGRIHFIESPTSATHFEIQYNGATNALSFNSPIDGTTNLFKVTRSGDATVSNNLTVTGEANIKNTIYSEFGSGDTDITGLLSGSAFGTWIKGRQSGHVVIGLSDNDNLDSFAIMSGSGNYTTDSTYDKLLARFQANGVITLGGNTTISGIITATGGNSNEWNTAYDWGDWSVGVDQSFVDALNINADQVDGKDATDFTLDYVTDNGATTTNNIKTGHIGIGESIQKTYQTGWNVLHFGDRFDIAGRSASSSHIMHNVHWTGTNWVYVKDGYAAKIDFEAGDGGINIDLGDTGLDGNGITFSTVNIDKDANITATSFIGSLTGNVTGNVTGNADTATNADKLDNLNSTQFLRSDAEDYTSRNLGVRQSNPIAALDVFGTTSASYPTAYKYAYSTDAGIRVYGNESSIDIVGNDIGDHGTSLLLRTANNGYGFINSPNDDALQLRYFVATADAFAIHGTATGATTTDLMTINQNGNISIDTGNLQMDGTTVIDASRNITAVDGSFSGDVTLNTSDADNGSVLRLANNADTINAGATLGTIEFYSGDNSGGGDSVKASIIGIQPATTPVYGELSFRTGNNTEHLLIDYLGNVSIIGGDFLIPDSSEIKLGDSKDLRIWHNGTNSYLDNYTGTLLIRNFANDQDIMLATDDGSGGNAAYVLCDGSVGDVKLYYASGGSSLLKFQTTNTGVSVTGNIDISGEITMQESHFINKRFDIDDNANGVQYVLLCVYAGANDVNGTITMDRTSGLRHACSVDIIVSAGSSDLPVGGLRSIGTSEGGNPSYKLVTCDYNTVTYVALEITNPDNYYESSGAYFTGRLVSTGESLLPKLASEISNIADFEANTQHNFDGEINLNQGLLKFGDTTAISDTRNFYADTTASNSVPRYRFSGDTDTGLGYIGTNAVGLIAGGSRKFYVNETTAYFQNLTGGVDISSGSLQMAGTSVITTNRDISANNYEGAGYIDIGSYIYADGNIRTNDGEFQIRNSTTADRWYSWMDTDTYTLSFHDESASTDTDLLTISPTGDLGVTGDITIDGDFHADELYLDSASLPQIHFRIGDPLVEKGSINVDSSSNMNLSVNGNMNFNVNANTAMTLNSTRQLTLTSDNLHEIYSATNEVGVGFKFSDNSSNSYGQYGTLVFFHTNTASYDSGAAFIIGSSEATTTILADGKLMYAEGIYSKPSSGTGAGTRKDQNWDLAYAYKTIGHLPLDGSQEMTGGILPSTNGTLNLGGSSNRWNIGYFNSLRITNVVTNRILKFNGSTIDDSLMTDDGATVTVGGNLAVDTDTLYVHSADNRVGIGTSSPNCTLHVDGDMSIQGAWFWYSGYTSTTGSGVANGTTIEWRDGITALNSAYMYTVRLTTSGTGTNSGSTYIVNYNPDTTTWEVRAVSLSGTNSNHPLLAMDGSTMVAYTNHTSSYPIRWSVETVICSDSDGTFHNMGADFMWQRNVDDLRYDDGKVGIGMDAVEKFEVAGNIKANTANGGGFFINGNSGIVRQGSEMEIHTNGASRLRISDTGVTTFNNNVNITTSNVGIPTTYGVFTIEATDSQIDLVSSSAGTWGSAINFVEGSSTTANTNVWSIARMTSGASNVLNFNFGTANQHDNTTQLALYTNGNANLTGNLGINGASSSAYPLNVTGSINTDTDYRVDGVAVITTTRGGTFADDVTVNGTLDAVNGVFTSDVNIDVTGNNRVLRLSRDNTTNGRLDIDFESALTNLESLGSFVFKIGSTPNEKMRLTSTGLGIGTTSPADKIHINGGNNFNGLTIEGTAPGIYLKDTQGTNAHHIASNGNYLYFLEDSDQNGSYNSILAYFKPNNDFVFNIGNVGIGVTNPIVKTEITGTLYAHGGSAWNGGGTEGDKTDAAIIIDEGDYIYTRDSSQYLRKLIGKNGDIIQIGETGTSLIDGTYFYSGVSCLYRWHDNTSVAMHLDGTGLGIFNTVPEYALDIVGGIRLLGEGNDGIRFDGGNADRTLIRVDANNDGESDSSDYGFSIRYVGSRSNNANSLSIYSDNQTAASQVEAFTMYQNGYIGIGQPTPSYRLDVGGDTRISGNLYATADVVAYQSSDRELKDNIKPIENAIDKVNKIGGYTFDWNDKQDTFEGNDVGVIAQEIEEVLPQLVATRDNGYKAVKYEKLVALLIEGMKEQQQQIDELKAKLDGITK